jgi:hypothetical protein
MSDTPSRQRMERGDNDPQTSGRSTNPRQYGRGKPFQYHKNKNNNGQQRNINSLTSLASMKFALQAAAKENIQTPFSTVKTHILNKIQASYEEGYDVAKSLDERSLLTLTRKNPSLKSPKKQTPLSRQLKKRTTRSLFKQR